MFGFDINLLIIITILKSINILFIFINNEAVGHLEERSTFLEEEEEEERSTFLEEEEEERSTFLEEEEEEERSTST